jgi:23S rRNA (cytosine1962-C5)-methyltransferase
MNKNVRLKAGKEKAILNKHHWIFSGAVAELPPHEPGEILSVESASSQFLGYAYFNKKSSILGRMISFNEDPLIAIEKSVIAAIAFRKALFGPETTAYRLINGEGDRLPGLIVDRYADTLVIQISTLGMEKLKDFILEILTRELKPQGILEKSLSPSRKEEGLAPLQQTLKGEVKPVQILENGLKFQVDPINGQKTGFFLDQREMRQFVRENAKNKRVLNCFSYTGGFTVYALAGGAIHAESVDISTQAIEEAKINCSLNGFKSQGHAEDVFEFLRARDLAYDMVILDPPAFAKRAKDVVSACRGYKDINRMALQKMPSGSILITSSCSYFVDEKLFQQVLFQAASDAKRTVRIIGKHRQAEDHPVNLFHPEGSYLKTLVLYVT